MNELQLFEQWANGTVLISNTRDYHALDALARFKTWKANEAKKKIVENERD